MRDTLSLFLGITAYGMMAVLPFLKPPPAWAVWVMAMATVSTLIVVALQIGKSDTRK